MSRRTLALGGLATLALVLVVVLVGTGGKDGYTVHLQMSDALGLRNGSKVVTGGVTVGRVHLKLGKGDAVDARLDLDPRFSPVGRDAQAVVTSVNLLGEKSLELDPGDRRRPAPDGSTLPAGKVTPSTDLDQVLDVLDTGTRDRLTILVNEAGQAVTGRKADFSQILNDFPTGLVEGNKLLSRVDGDHRTLVDLVAKSDAFVGALAADRKQLGNTLDELGQAAQTSETQRPELLQTLQRLPGTLTTAQAFLEDLRQTAIPLGPAARRLTAAAGPLRQTLEEIGPFTDAAVPALHRATDAAPALSRLATGATPVVREAVPTLRTLASSSRSLAPVSTLLDHSANNIVGVAANWAHAIQGRDSLSHVFRAEVAVSPQTTEELVSRLLAYEDKQGDKRKQGERPPASGPGGVGDVPPLKLPDGVKGPATKLTDPVRKLPGQVAKTVKGVVGDSGPAAEAADDAAAATDSLLGFLLDP